MTGAAFAEESSRLQRRTTSDTVADELRAAIVRGDFEDGMELNQVDLARRFGVSRVPIREALRQLRAEGLITSEPHMRAAVVGHTLERILEILDLRVLLESYLLRRSAPRLTEADLAEVRKIYEKMTKNRSHDEWLALNTAFHDKLYSRADAPVASDLAHQLSLRVQRYVRMARADGRKRHVDAVEEHRAILEAVEKGDFRNACKLLEQHIQHTTEQVRRIFENGAPAGAGAAAQRAQRP